MDIFQNRCLVFFPFESDWAHFSSIVQVFFTWVVLDDIASSELSVLWHRVSEAKAWVKARRPELWRLAERELREELMMYENSKKVLNDHPLNRLMKLLWRDALVFSPIEEDYKGRVKYEVSVGPKLR